MPRSLRVATGGIVYHVLNRSNGRVPLFESDGEYESFLTALAEAHERTPMRTIGYCVMPTHWHLVLWPRGDGDLSEFMRWLTVTHTQRWHAAHRSAGGGHVYRGRFKSFPVQSRRVGGRRRAMGWLEGGDPVLSVLRYVERNALRARRVRRAENWRWGSLQQRLAGAGVAEDRPPLTAPPGGLPANWLKLVNRPQSDEELAAMNRSIQRGSPLGGDAWVRRAAAELGLASTLRPRGRPRKKPQKGS